MPLPQRKSDTANYTALLKLIPRLPPIPRKPVSVKEIHSLKTTATAAVAPKAAPKPLKKGSVFAKLAQPKRKKADKQHDPGTFKEVTPIKTVATARRTTRAAAAQQAVKKQEIQAAKAVKAAQKATTDIADAAATTSMSQPPLIESNGGAVRRTKKKKTTSSSSGTHSFPPVCAVYALFSVQLMSLSFSVYGATHGGAQSRRAKKVQQTAKSVEDRVEEGTVLAQCCPFELVCEQHHGIQP